MKGKYVAFLLAAALLLHGFGCVRDVPPSNTKTVKLSVPNLMGG
jgi:hypothetical protein